MLGRSGLTGAPGAAAGTCVLRVLLGVGALPLEQVVSDGFELLEPTELHQAAGHRRGSLDTAHGGGGAPAGCRRGSWADVGGS